MKFLNAPRQPFVGLSLMAAIGIVIADVFPLPCSALIVATIILAACIVILAYRPVLLATYAIVGSGFFLLHNLGQATPKASNSLTNLATGHELSRQSDSWSASRRLRRADLQRFCSSSSQLNSKAENNPTRAVWQVRWKGTPEFGDELKLFGKAEIIPPPRNPGEFDMRSYLARRDVRRMLFVRYPEDGTLIRHGGGNHILRSAEVPVMDGKSALPRIG